MNKKIADGNTISCLEDLIKELDKLSDVLTTFVKNNSNLNFEQSLAVVKIFSGISPVHWQKLTESYNFNGWFLLQLTENQRNNQKIKNNSAYKINTIEEFNLLNSLMKFNGYDELTKLPLQEPFERNLIIELERAESINSEISLVLFSINNYLTIQDQCGDIEADKLIIFFVELLKANKRVYDFIARLKDSEFALLLPNSSLLRAKITTENIIEEFEQNIFRLNEDKNYASTISAGIVTEKVTFELKPIELLTSANQALQEAIDSNKPIQLAHDNRILNKNSMVQVNEKLFLFSGQPTSM